MAEREMKRAVAAHRNSRDRSRRACGLRAIASLDRGHEFLQEKIFIATAAIERIYVEASARGGSHDQEAADLACFPPVFDYVEPARVDEHLLVITQSVQVIKDGIAPRRVRVVARRQQDAVGNCLP